MPRFQVWIISILGKFRGNILEIYNSIIHTLGFYKMWFSRLKCENVVTVSNFKFKILKRDYILSKAINLSLLNSLVYWETLYTKGLLINVALKFYSLRNTY